jgi:hypothetical protein
MTIDDMARAFAPGTVNFGISLIAHFQFSVDSHTRLVVRYDVPYNVS